MDASDTARRIAATLFVGGLAVVFLALFWWALNPEPEGGIALTDRDGPDDAAQTTTTDQATPAPPTPAATPTPTPTGPTAEELQEAAKDPAETVIQVLDAGAGSEATQAAAARLEELGYQVQNITSARARPAATTVWYTEGAEDEARALRARDERFAEIEPNQGLAAAVDLHLLVADDW